MGPSCFRAVAILVLNLIGAGFGFGAAAQDQTVTLTSLDWPPYTGENLPNQGTSAEKVKAAFKAMGYVAGVEILPWSRAVEEARRNPEVIGYFPKYFEASTEDSFIFSQIIGESPLGFVEPVSAPVVWDTLADLKGLTIGIVRGYANTEAFDSMVAAGELKVDVVNNDLINVRKVLAGRLPLAVIDKNVLDYLLATNPDLVTGKTALQFNKKPLEQKDLFVCFRKDAEGEKMVRIFNEGFRKIGAGKSIRNDRQGD